MRGCGKLELKIAVEWILAQMYSGKKIWYVPYSCSCFTHILRQLLTLALETIPITICGLTVPGELGEPTLSRRELVVGEIGRAHV